MKVLRYYQDNSFLLQIMLTEQLIWFIHLAISNWVTRSSKVLQHTNVGWPRIDNESMGHYGGQYQGATPPVAQLGVKVIEINQNQL